MRALKLAEVTARRKMVKELADQGLLIPAIAEQMGISTPTVRTDIVAIAGQEYLTKLVKKGIRNRNNVTGKVKPV